MPTIWEDEYLENHTKKQLNTLLDSYENAEWQCPRCEEVNPVWSRDRVIRGWDDFGTKYTYNKWCYECNYVRPSGTAHNLNGKAPKPKRVKSMPTFRADLRYHANPKDYYSGKQWTIEMYKSAKIVRVYWGKIADTAGGFKEYSFDNFKEACAFYDKKINEKVKKGYYASFPNSVLSDGTDLYEKPKRKKAVASRKSTRSPIKRKSSKTTKKAPAKTRAKKKALTKKK